ncbi:MAG TPA: adenylate kinase [Planctomycetota bacterium]|jgi:adenylate kinase
MRLIFEGPPGSGKGTQAKKLSERRGWVHISTGDLLREAVRNRTPVGLTVESVMKEGRLVSDATVVEIIEERFRRGDCADGFILDGFPRTLGQAEALDRILSRLKLPAQRVIVFEVRDEIIVERITGRRSCPVCQTPYHVKFVPPRKPGICDKEGTALVQRPDDAEDRVRTRLAKYHEETEPVIPFYERRGLVRRVDGGAPPEGVFKAVERALA